MRREDIAAWRMRNLRLTGAPFLTPGDAVGWLAAAQSQDYGPAKWSVAQRTDGLGDADLERAFAAGALVRTHVLRPTWHFVRPADLRWMLALTGPRVHAANAYQYRQLGLDDEVRQRCEDLLRDALRGGNHLTRKELAEVLAGAGVAADGLRLGYIMMSAELNAVICGGAPRARRQTYALVDERVPEAPALTREAALAELTLRYFTSHGPATAKDFRWWSSLTLTEIAKGLDLVADRLHREVIDGVPYWYADGPPAGRAPSPAVQLLQAYDEYLVGYSESKYLLDVSGLARSLTERRVPFNQVVILDTQVVGYWKRTVGATAVRIEVAAHRPLDEAEAAALRDAADRHGVFLGVEATVNWRLI